MFRNFLSCLICCKFLSKAAWDFLPRGLAWRKPCEAVATHWPHFKWAMAVVAFVQLVLFVNESLQHLKSIDRNMRAVANTSKVCATRANLMEWRSCLAFSAKWHQCSVQGAYLLWQKKQSSVPACPASQRMLLETGQPLSQLDQYQADSDWPAIRLKVYEIDSYLSVAHENFLLMTVAKQQFPEAVQAKIHKWETQYKQWSKVAEETDGLNLNQFMEQIKEAVGKYSDSTQWDEPAFQFN